MVYLRELRELKQEVMDWWRRVRPVFYLQTPLPSDTHYP